jgi:hypothetical protein
MLFSVLLISVKSQAAQRDYIEWSSPPRELKMQKKEMPLHYCPSAKVHVHLKTGLEACLTEHQCFSDDPCPLMQAFLKHNVHTKPNAPQSGTKDTPLA